MKIPVIRDACGEIVAWFDSQAEAEANLMYMGEEEELSEATVDEVFEFEFGAMSVEEILSDILTD